MPSGTAMIAARTNPPTTRQTVIPMSPTNPCSAKRLIPSRTIVRGSARNVFATKPPNVAADHTTTNRMKNRMPSATRVGDAIGLRGVTPLPSSGPPRTASRRSLDEARVDDRVQVRHALDDSHLDQQVGRFLAE